MKYIPHHYQQTAQDYVQEKRSCALVLDLGLGKTVVTGSVIVEQMELELVDKVLIVAPKRVALHTWPAELEKWDHLQNLTYQVIQGTPKKRERLVSGDEDIHIINYENLVWLVKHFGRRWPYDLVVFDEISKMKSPGSKRFRAFRQIRPLVRNVIGLTGTPASNGLLDLWAQMWLIDTGKRLGRTFTAYKDRWFFSDHWGHTWMPRGGAEDEINERIADIAISMSAEDYLELPDRVDVVDRVYLNDNQMADYAHLERDLYIQLDQGEVTAVNAAVLTGKCRQYTAGALYHDEQDSWEEVHQEKLNALEDIIEAADGPVLVAYEFRSDLERLRQRFPQGRTIDNGDAIDSWNRGEIPILFAHPASAGHGLNLQDGGHRIVWFSLTWSLELYQQFNGRLHRQGQTKPVTVHHLVCDDTIDAVVLDALQHKRSVQDALLDAIKSSHRNSSNDQDRRSAQTETQTRHRLLGEPGREEPRPAA